MSNNLRCHCGNPSVCYEVRSLTPNRGRWYWKCATNACDFFAWDTSALPFITHPYAAYNSQPQLDLEFAKRRRYAINSRRNNVRSDAERPVPKVTVSFSILSKEQIGIEIKGTQTQTIEPVIAALPDIGFDPVLNQWVIKANITDYRRAVKAIPTNLRNVQVELDCIPPTALETLFLTEDQREVDDVQARWAKFVETDYNNMEHEYQRQGVQKGLELNGRVMLSNVTGLDGIPIAFSLLKLYKEDWPVLLMCPKSMCFTWRHRVMTYFKYNKRQVIVADHKYLRAEAERAAKRIRLDLERSGQQDSDDSDSDSDDEEEEDDHPKFVIVDFEKAYNDEIHLIDQGFKIVLMDNSDSLRFRMHSRTGKIAKIVQSRKRVIMLSEMSYRALPVEMFVQISAVQEKLFPDFNTFAKRYCNARQEVFGWRHDGRTHATEYKFVMDKVVWYAPLLSKTSIHLREIYRHQILSNILVKHRDGFAENLEKLMMDDYFERDEAHEKKEIIENMYEDTGKAKIEFMNHYIRHIFESHWKQNIAIFYQHKTVVTEIEKQLKNTKGPIDYIHIDKQEDLQSKMSQFMRERTTRVLLVNMSLENLKLVHSVDMVIMTEMPLEKEHVERIESVFKIESRKWPLSIRYLHAPGSLDDYLWKEHFGSDSII